jgi:ferredoxin-thioredoxin reductase catalytic subunit
MDKQYSTKELHAMAVERSLVTHDGDKPQLIAALIIQKRSEGRMMVNKPISEKSITELKSTILLYASQHGLAIDPSKELNAFCVRVVRMKHCVCVDTRLYCPCSESLGEVESTGYCMCHLFVRRDLYNTALKTAQYYMEKKAAGRFVEPKEKKGRR